MPAFARIILGKQLAQSPRLHAHQRISRGIEFGFLAEHVDGDGITLEPFGLAGLFAADEIAEQLARTFRSLERLA